MGSKRYFRAHSSLYLGIPPGREQLTLPYPRPSRSLSRTMSGVCPQLSTSGTSPQPVSSISMVIIQLLSLLPGDTCSDPGRLDQGKWRIRLCGWFIKLCGFLLFHKTPHQRVRLGSCWALSSFVVGIGLCFLPLCFRFKAFLLQSEQFYLTAASLQLPRRANWIHLGGKCRATRG